MAYFPQKPPCDQFYPGFAPPGGNNLPDPDIGGGVGPEPPDPDPDVDLGTDPSRPPHEPPKPGDPGWYCPTTIDLWFAGGSQGCVYTADGTNTIGARVFKTKQACDTIAGCLPSGGGETVYVCDLGLLDNSNPDGNPRCTAGFGSDAWPRRYGDYIFNSGSPSDSELIRCGAVCSNQKHWLCSNGQCVLGVPNSAYDGPLFDTKFSCVQSCLGATVDGWVCFPGDGCFFLTNQAPGPGIYETETECVTNCTISTGGGEDLVSTTGDSAICKNAGISNYAIDSTQFNIWCEKFRNGTSDLITYKGKDSRVILPDGNNCPPGMPHVDVDGDGCRFCTNVDLASVNQYGAKKLGGDNSDSRMVIGTPGTQGNCATGYVVEVDDVERSILKCTPEGYCTPFDCLGKTLNSSKLSSLSNPNIFEEVSRFIVNLNDPTTIEATKLGFEEDDYYNFTINRRISNIELVKNTKFPNTIFGPRVVNKLIEAEDQVNTTVFNSSLPSEITKERIKTSISAQAKIKLSNIRNNLGGKLSETSIYDGLKTHILLGNASNITISELDELVDNQNIDSPDKKFLRELSPNAEEIISYGLFNKKSASFNNNDYTVNQKKKLENVFIPASELYEKFYIQGLSGTYEFTVNNDYTIPTQLIDGSTVYFEVAPDHTVVVTRANMEEERCPTVNNLNNTYLLDNYYNANILNWKNIKTPYSLTVSSTDEEIEFTHSVNGDAPEYLVLELLPNTLSKELTNGSPIEITTANYRYIEDPETNVDFNNRIKHRMGPWLNISTSYQDPINYYIKDGSGITIQLEQKHFGLNALGSQLGEITFASKIPYLIFVTPTNKFSRNPFGLLSSMESINKRKLDLSFGYFKSDTNTGLSTPLHSEFSYNVGNKGIRNDVDTQSIEFNFGTNSKLLKPKTNYLNSEIPKNKALGIRRYKRLLERIKQAYNLEDDIKVSQFDLFSRFTASEFFSLDIASPKTSETIKKTIEETTDTEVVTVSKKDPIKSKLLSLKVSETEIPQFITYEENYNLFGGKYNG